MSLQITTADHVQSVLLVDLPPGGLEPVAHGLDERSTTASFHRSARLHRSRRSDRPARSARSVRPVGPGRSWLVPKPDP